LVVKLYEIERLVGLGRVQLVTATNQVCVLITSSKVNRCGNPSARGVYASARATAEVQSDPFCAGILGKSNKYLSF